MELTKLQRTLISRGTALALGLFLAYLAIGCFHWGERARTDPVQQQLRMSGYSRAQKPLLLPYGLMVGFGIAAATMVGLAVVPTRWLYAMDPRPSEVDAIADPGFVSYFTHL